MTIDLNCDMGESYGVYTIGNDDAVMPFISSANIACGYHAGDPIVIGKTIRLALHHAVAIGAHPGYPDREGFGRRSLQMTTEEIYAMVLYQVSALKSMTEALGGTLHHVKPHGALYNDAAQNPAIALAITRAVKDIDSGLLFFGLASSEMITAARHTGLQPVSEIFADRSYNDDGSLVHRSKPGAVLSDMNAVSDRIVSMVKTGKVITVTGKTIPIAAETICIHGDNPHAPEFASTINERLKKEGITIQTPQR